jgi:cytidylate kinase
MAVITISREYGSGGGGGNQVAARVCDILGYQYFDKRLMAQLASEMGVTEAEVVDFSEDTYKIRNFLERLPGRRGPRVIAQVRVWHGAESGDSRQIQELDESYGISLAKGTIHAAYEHGNVVIVGRGGQVILKDKPGVLHVRIEAPLEVRKQRVAEQEKISLAAAEELIVNRDRAASAYLKRFYDIDWADPRLYDLVINTHKWDVETTARLIINTASFLPTVESHD